MNFTLEELELLADLTDPVLNHARIDGDEQLERVTNLHRRIELEARRQGFHEAVASTPPDKIAWGGWSPHLNHG